MKTAILMFLSLLVTIAVLGAGVAMIADSAFEFVTAGPSWRELGMVLVGGTLVLASWHCADFAMGAIGVIDHDEEIPRRPE